MEWALLLFSSGAACYTGYMLWGRLNDWFIARRRYRYDSKEWIVSVDRAFDESFRFAKCLALLIGAICAIWMPPPPPNYGEVPQSLVFLTVMSIVAILIFLNSWRSIRAQAKLEEKEDARVKARAKAAKKA
jgi:purine-cytosine permease-like protein